MRAWKNWGFFCVGNLVQNPVISRVDMRAQHTVEHNRMEGEALQGHLAYKKLSNPPRPP